MSAVGVLILAWFVVDLRSPDAVITQTAGLAVFSLITAVASVVAIITGLIYFWYDDGARLLPSEHRGTHKLVYPGR